MSTKKERTIVTAIAFCVSALIGYKVADTIYTKSCVAYMRIFHKEEYLKALAEVLKEATEEL